MASFSCGPLRKTRCFAIDKELEAHEDFLGFCNVPDFGAETIVSAIKDGLLKLQLSLVNCRAQCYDGASNMMEHKTGMAKRIQDLQPKACPPSCHGQFPLMRNSSPIYVEGSLDAKRK